MSDGGTPPVLVEDVRLRYVLSSGAQSLRDVFVGRGGRRKVVDALDGVSFAVSPGEVTGVVGHNGAGKTTLLKVLARVLGPTTGRVVVRGTVSPLIALGAGFDPELTGRENIVLFGAMLGRQPQVMRDRAQQIAEWAGVEEFLDSPVRVFSSGMVSRLAFSVAVDVEPDVLLVDEALAVGDEAFQAQSLQRIKDLVGNGACALLVTHDLNQVSAHCTSAVWLDHGRLRMHGPASDVIEAYRAV